MIDVVEATEGALALGFAAVTLLALRARIRRGHPSFAWLAATFVSLALGTAFGRQLATVVDTGAAEFVLRGARALAFFPGYFLLRFLHEIEPAPAWLRRLALVGAVAPAVAVVAGTAAPTTVVEVGGVHLLLGGLFALSCVTADVWVAGRLASAARRIDASVLRRRLFTMAWAAGLSGSLVLLAFVSTPLAALLSRLAAFTAVVLLWFAVHPPRLLRLHARHRDSQRVRTLRQSLMRAPHPAALADELVRSVSELTGAEAAWLHVGDRVVSRHRAPADVVDAHDMLVRGLTGPGLDGRALVRLAGTPGWVAAAPVGDGWLAIRVTAYTPVFGADELATLDAVAEDLSLAMERTRSVDREREASRRVEHAARLKDDFLSTMSHELRTPLTSIRGFAELLLTSGARLEPAARADLLARILRNAGDLETMLTGLLQLTSLRDGSRASRAGVHTVDRVIEAAVRRTAVACEAHEVRLQIEPATLVVDAEALSDALEQLLLNAAKFSPPGSPISVRAGRSGDALVVSVEDHGVGMTEEERGALFEPFRRAGDVLTRETRGAGVGLAIVAKLVALLEGRIEVVSEPNEGSTFTIVFPALAPPSLVDDDGGIVDHATEVTVVA